MDAGPGISLPLPPRPRSASRVIARLPSSQLAILAAARSPRIRLPDFRKHSESLASLLSRALPDRRPSSASPAVLRRWVFPGQNSPRVYFPELRCERTGSPAFLAGFFGLFGNLAPDLAQSRRNIPIIWDHARPRGIMAVWVGPDQRSALGGVEKAASRTPFFTEERMVAYGRWPAAGWNALSRSNQLKSIGKLFSRGYGGSQKSWPRFWQSPAANCSRQFHGV